ncbi:MAG TPA: elongation factor P [Patescibacteria group bacterium]|nr:elongation factor P [Patescibacteria group bacterium]
MTLKITDLKKGTIFKLDNKPYKVVEYNQKVIGRGGSIVNVKIKNLINSKVLDKTFKGSDQIEHAEVTQQSAQYLYKNGQILHFMNANTYDQLSANEEIITDSASYIKEGDNVQLEVFDGQIININLPKNVNLRVEYCEPAIKGDTTTAITKIAKLETGASIKVPAFIKTGDLISVDTQTGSYRERVKT